MEATLAPPAPRRLPAPWARREAGRLLHLLLCLLFMVSTLPVAAWAGVSAVSKGVQGAVNGVKKSTKKAASKSAPKSTSKGKTSASSKKKKVGTSKRRTTRRSYRTLPSTQPYAAAIVIDSESGAVLFQKDPDEERAPASLTKMMTELVTLEALEAGEVSLDDVVVVPEGVQTIGGTRLRLKAGERLTLEDAVRAMVIASANDAAYTVACHVAGSEGAFVGRMNARARDLGMSHTRYVNPHGLDRGDAPGTVTTARDQALLAQALLRYDRAIEFSSTVRDTIRGGQVVNNTNKLLGQYPGMDGLKTGYTGKAGYCLCTTAERDELRLISVLLGGSTSRRRFNESARLLDDAFSRYQRIKVLRKGEDLGQSLSITGGTPSELPLVAAEDVGVVVKNGQQVPPIRFRVNAPSSARAPVPADQPIGTVEVLVGDSVAVTAQATVSRSATSGWPLFFRREKRDDDAR